MGIRSTQYITRESVFERIQLVHSCKLNNEHELLNENTFETDNNVQGLMVDSNEIDKSNIHNWTNEMITDLLDDLYMDVPCLVNNRNT